MQRCGHCLSSLWLSESSGWGKGLILKEKEEIGWGNLERSFRDWVVLRVRIKWCESPHLCA